MVLHCILWCCMVLHDIALHHIFWYFIVLHMQWYCIKTHGIVCYCIVGVGARAVSPKPPIYFIIINHLNIKELNIIGIVVK